jgi:hypothetical protein
LIALHGLFVFDEGADQLAVLTRVIEFTKENILPGGQTQLTVNERVGF